MVGGTVTKLLIELNKNKLDVDEEEYNSKKFDIKFSVKVGRLSPTQFELRNILQEKFQNESTPIPRILNLLLTFFSFFGTLQYHLFMNGHTMGLRQLIYGF